MEKYLLTPMQQGILFDCLKSPSDGYYIQQLVCTFPKIIDVDIICESWKQSVKANKVLRTRFCTDDSGEIRQFFTEDTSFQFKILYDDAFDKDTFLSNQRSSKINILNDSLWSITLVCSKEKTEMIWCFHHIILDGRSHSLILEDVFRNYNSIVDQTTLENSDVVEFTQYLKLAESIEVDCDFWNRELGSVTQSADLDVGESEIIYDDSKKIFNEQKCCLSEQETFYVVEFCNDNSFSVNCLLQSAWSFLLYKYKGIDNVVFGTTRACRHLSGKDFSSTCGMLINTVPFAVHIDGTMRVNKLLSQNKDTQLRLRSVEGNSPSDISSCLTSAFGSDLLKSILIFENHDINEHLQQLGGICEGMNAELREKVDSFTVAGYLGKILKLVISYPLNKYSNKQIEYVLKHLKNVLLAFVRNSNSKLDDLAFIEDDEKKMLLNEFAGYTSTQDFNTNIIKEFEKQVKSSPDNVALELPDLTTISYRKLNNRANQLANYLISLGYKKGDCIAVCMDRCSDLVVSILAIFKAGMTYVPVDISSKRDRVLFYIENSGAKIVLTLERLSQNIPEIDVKLILVDRDEYVICKQDTKNLNVELNPLDVAYILYTSGSTGVPKGVEVYHRGIVSLAKETTDLLGMVETDRILLLSTPSFDVSLYEILMGIYVGATLCVEHWENLISGENLAETFVDRKITAVSVTPTAIMNAPILDGFKLRMVMCCGEVCHPDIFLRWGKGRKWRLFNGYGPTEVTIWTTCEE